MRRSTTLQIQPFSVAEAGDSEFAALNDHGNRVHSEQRPDDPPMPLAERIAHLRHVPEFIREATWAAWNEDQTAIVAAASIRCFHGENNHHVAEFSIDVEPGYRRRGLGRRLLADVIGHAQKDGRRVLITGTSDRIPAGDAFLERVGAVRGLETHTSQLDLAGLDRGLLRAWIESGAQRASGFRVGVWTGPYPEERIGAIADLLQVMNTAPRGDLEFDDIRLTPEQLRQMEHGLSASGTERWTCYAEELATGRLAGFTEVFWNANRPHLVGQGGTGVFPEFRNRGLGRWLKAAMLETIVAERPGARFVRTGNADSNAAMLKINRALGFQPYISHSVWQLETAKARAYLDRCAPPAVPT